MAKGPTQDELPIAILLFGQSYVQAAKILVREIAAHRARLRYDDPILFLAGHGLELMYKAYLRAQGTAMDDLKGHNLDRLL